MAHERSMPQQRAATRETAVLRRRARASAPATAASTRRKCQRDSPLPAQEAGAAPRTARPALPAMVYARFAAARQAAAAPEAAQVLS